MDAVLLGVLAGALFGAMTVAVRWGLVRGGDPVAGVPVISGTAFAVAGGPRAARPERRGVGDLAAFFAVGVFVPGLSQVAFVSAVRHAGPVPHGDPHRHGAARSPCSSPSPCSARHSTRRSSPARR